MRIPISDIINSQLPSFVREEYPLFSEFLKQYYLSDVSEKLIQNLDKNLDVDVIFNLKTETILTSDVNYNDSTIEVDSTFGFADQNGLIKINDEIIFYVSKTETSFLNCVRGFSGIDKIDKTLLSFSETELDRHVSNSIVYNLNIISLQQFVLQIKKRITPGFEERALFSSLNAPNFVKNIKSFYTSKGSDESFRILFGALYGKHVDVIKPRDFLIRPSDAQYRVTKDLVVEVIEGDPYSLINSTVYQDKTIFSEPAQGTVVEVSKIIQDNKEFFVISLDYEYNRDIDVSGTIKSEFSIHAKTLCTSKIQRGSNYIDVDSTVGFPDSGTLRITLEDGTIFDISYASKVLNQFLDCTGIEYDLPEKTEIKINDYIYGFDVDGNIISLFVTGVLGDIDYIDPTFYYKKGEKLGLKTLGSNIDQFKFNNWFFNISVNYDVQEISIEDNSDFSYRVTLFDNHNFVIGDYFTLYASDGLEYNGRIIFVENEKNIIIKGQGELNSIFTYRIKKNISKVDVINNELYNLSKYNSNIQNIYTDYDDSLYVSSPSLPTYLDYPLEIKNLSVKVSAGNYDGLYDLSLVNSHSFFTGDSVVYRPKNEENSILDSGIYFILRVSDKKVKLARSASNIDQGIFVQLSGSITTGNESILEKTDFNDINLNSLELRPQNKIKKIIAPQLLTEKENTEPGPIGMLVNGVEITNYKSQDLIYYGEIEDINVLDGGDGYSITSPPVITVTDLVGYGVSLVTAVEGNLERIDIIDPGFGYIETPTISITGGGGSGARAVAELTEFIHSSDFSAETAINFSENSIDFNTDHRFENNEQVIYDTKNQRNIVGIDTNSKYYVGVIDSRRVNLYSNLSDSSAGINTINFSAAGIGIQSFRSLGPKKKISNIKVIDSGFGYKNKKVKISSVDHRSGYATVKDHGFKTGEIVSITIFNNFDFLHSVTVIDKDTVALSTYRNGVLLSQDESYEVFSELLFIYRPDINFLNNGYNNLLYDIFEASLLYDLDFSLSYPRIIVNIEGKIGVTTTADQDFNAQIQPIFKGKIYDVVVENGGNYYGSETIINYEKQPIINIQTGKNAQVSPIIVNGSITEVIVNASGSEYTQEPDLIVTPVNNEVVLTPVISGGQLVDVIVVNGGTGLDPDSTRITVSPSGSGAKLSANIKSRRINNVQKLINSNNITRDDGFLIRSDNSLQYTHLYSPRSLRSSIVRKVGDKNRVDLEFKSGKELRSTAHSPVLGWAYDGNPIYGPYGYLNGNSGPVSALRTGYRLKTTTELNIENRPALSLFPIGTFVDDYIFTGGGDLDEHNGRFCVTPEYPNGVYAYFCTISEFLADQTSPFFNYFQPVFPYIIGNSYKNKPYNDNQSFESLGKNLLRNTIPYNLLQEKSRYEFVFNPVDNEKYFSDIVKTNTSSVDSIKILTPGDSYAVNDLITLTNGTTARVKEIEGSVVTAIGISNVIFNNLEVVPFKNSFIGVLTAPHNLNSLEEFKFNSQYELNRSISVIPYKVNLLLSDNILPSSITGIITYFPVSGNLDFPLKENDIYEINNEKVKVLAIDNKSSRIRVEREYLGTTGITTHPIGSLLSEDSRKVTFNTGLSTTYDYILNSEIYFNPLESVGVGIVTTHTLSISNPGFGKTIITIPSRTIYIENHNLASGDSVYYSSNGGDPIEISYTGVGSTIINENQELFVTKVSNNLIGLSTQLSQDNSLVYYTSIGTGLVHSLRTNYANGLIGSISKNTVTVSTASSHGLNLADTININVSSGTTAVHKIYYNDTFGRFYTDIREVEAVDVTNNIIYSTNHKFDRGTKVIYESGNTVYENSFYYVIPITKDSFKVSSSYYNAIRINPISDTTVTDGGGYFYPINPEIKITKNQDIIFDVSDESLSYLVGTQRLPAFELNLYYDVNRLNPLHTYDLIKENIVGVDTSARYILKTKNIPDNIFYSIDAINNDTIPEVKRNIFHDITQLKALQLNKVESLYSGTHILTGISATSFSYHITDYPEIENYNMLNSDILYWSNSNQITGPIHSLIITNSAKSNEIPRIESIVSENGSDAVLLPQSTTIGSIVKTNKSYTNFNYSVDYTIRPQVNISKILKLESLNQIDSVGISTRAFGYTYPPDLILINTNTGQKYDDVLFNYDLKSISIAQNTNKIENNNIKIVPINNDNGFEIDGINFNIDNKTIVVTLKTAFSRIEDFPFIVGETVYIENVPTADNNSMGYNSSNYNYTAFEITDSTPRIGGAGATFAYNMTNFVGTASSLGEVDNFYTSGFAIPGSYLPTFEVTIKANEYIKGEKIITSSNTTGEIVEWDSQNNILKVISKLDIGENEYIYGETSKNYTRINEVIAPRGYINVQSNSVTNKGWSDRIGFLNDNLQRIHDSNYYQYFSYDLRSEIDYVEWSDSVDSLNHVSGFKKFGNLLIESEHSNVGFATEQNLGDVEVINDLDSTINVNCFNDFDLVTENYFNIDEALKSNEIYFQSRRLQNYIESTGNKVVMIDDISGNFKPIEPIVSTVIDSFNKLLYRFKKYIIHITDRLEPTNTQSLILSVIHDDQNALINQYCINDSRSELGYFDVNIKSRNADVNFIPYDTSNTLYSINSFSFNISDSDDLTGNLVLGDSVSIESNKNIGIGTTTITSIPDSKSAVKLLIVYSGVGINEFYSDEINYIQDGTNIFYNSYGGLNIGNNSGIGTYSLEFNNSNVDIIIHPNENVEYNINTMSIEISDTNSTSTDFIILSGNKLESSYVGVTTNGTPERTLLYEYDNNYRSGLHQILIENTDNGDVDYNEIASMLNSLNQEVYSIQFGRLTTRDILGEMEVEYNETTGNLEIYFTPDEDINYQAKIFSTLTSQFRRSDTLQI